MKLKFFLDHVKRDMKLLPQPFIESEGHKMVKLEDVFRIIQRWETALETEDTLNREAERLEELLNKEGSLSRAEAQEAFEIIMLIHMPLVEGQNDVIGVRMRDADYFRLQNKVMGRPLDEGLEDYEEKQRKMLLDRKAAKKKKNEESKARQRKLEEAEAERMAQQVRKYLDKD